MLRVALFGAGRIGQVHARSITEHGDARLAWVCDPIEQAATRARRRSTAPSGASTPRTRSRTRASTRS